MTKENLIVALQGLTLFLLGTFHQRLSAIESRLMAPPSVVAYSK